MVCARNRGRAAPLGSRARAISVFMAILVWWVFAGTAAAVEGAVIYPWLAVGSTNGPEANPHPESSALLQNNTEEAARAEAQMEEIYARHRFVLIAMFASTFLFLLVLFASYPRRREHLFVALTLLSCLAAMVSLHISEVTTDRALWHFTYYYLFLGFTVLSVIFGLGLLEIALTGRLAKVYYAYAALGAALYLVAPCYSNDLVHVFPVLCLPEVMRIFYVALKTRHMGTKLLLGVSALLFVLVVLNALGSIVEWPEQNGFLRYLPWYGFAVFIQIMLVMLAREFARAMTRVEQLAASLEDKVARRTCELEAEIQVRKQTEQELKESLSQVKVLRGLLPICAACKKVRDDSGYWNQIEVYIRTHSEAEFTHSLCPQCLTKLYPEFQVETGEHPD